MSESTPIRAYTLFLAFATFILVFAGGLVTSTGSALAVPDWPLSFGQFFPPMVGGVLYEHGHRMIAAFVGAMTVILAVWLSKSAVDPHLRRAGWIAVILVGAQGVLGGVTVLLKLPALTAVSHACLGQIFFSWMCSIAAIASSAPRGTMSAPAPVIAKERRLAMMTSGFVLFQLVAGAIYRHTGYLFHVHLFGALLVVIHVLLLARRTFGQFRADAWLAGPAATLVGLVAVQVVLGLLAWRIPGVTVGTTHVAVGALILATSTVLTVQTFRRLDFA